MPVSPGMDDDVRVKLPPAPAERYTKALLKRIRTAKVGTAFKDRLRDDVLAVCLALEMRDKALRSHAERLRQHTGAEAVLARVRALVDRWETAPHYDGSGPSRNCRGCKYTAAAAADLRAALSAQAQPAPTSAADGRIGVGVYESAMEAAIKAADEAMLLVVLYGAQPSLVARVAVTAYLFALPADNPEAEDGSGAPIHLEGDL